MFSHFFREVHQVADARAVVQIKYNIESEVSFRIFDIALDFIVIRMLVNVSFTVFPVLGSF